MHLFTVELNKFENVDVSYLSHPNLKLMEALLMTCSIPILMNPVFINTECYIDGGILLNYPLCPCLEKYGCEEKENILGIKQEFLQCENHNDSLNSTSNLIQYFIHIFRVLILKIQINNNGDPNSNTQNIKIKEIVCNENFMTFSKIMKTLSNIQYRKDIVEKGVIIAREFMIKQEQQF